LATVAFSVAPSYRADHGVVAEHHPVYVNDHQLDFLEAPPQQGLDLSF
jgi:hypothetical protein